jgi:hypothetical protein
MDRKPFVRKWTRRWRKASTKCLKSWHTQGKGTLSSNTGNCEAALAFHFYKGKTCTGGTGSGYYPQITSLLCKRRGRTYTCTNAYLNWGRCQGWRGVVVVVGVLGRSVDARAYLGPRPGLGR